jgi:predicted nucleotidyltransferase
MTESSFIPETALGDHELDLIRTVLRQTAGLTKARLFGSRAKGIASTRSDIDLAVEGLSSSLELEALRDRLNELPLPYVVDVIAVEGIQNAALRDHIARWGCLLFERKAS